MVILLIRKLNRCCRRCRHHPFFSKVKIAVGCSNVNIIGEYYSILGNRKKIKTLMIMIGNEKINQEFS